MDTIALLQHTVYALLKIWQICYTTHLGVFGWIANIQACSCAVSTIVMYAKYKFIYMHLTRPAEFLVFYYIIVAIVKF